MRALGPSVPVAGALADPTLELHNGSGTLVASNDNWKTRSDGSSQQQEIEATSIPPTNDLESALVRTLPAGNYTAIVRGMDNTTGVGLVEALQLAVAREAARLERMDSYLASENSRIGEMSGRHSLFHWLGVCRSILARCAKTGCLCRALSRRGLVLVQPCVGGSGVFENTGSLATGRAVVTRRRCCPTARCSSQADISVAL